MTENIQPQIVKSISSRQTVNSETQTRAISLGEALVQELSLEPGTDTLSKWMAHYIAEQIATSETATGREKIEAEKQCFDAILKLWAHRASLPNNRYPFKNFEPIFNTLSSLDPDNSRSYYLDNSHIQKTENNDASENQADKIQLWMNLALSIDAAARVLIDFVIMQAAHNAEDEETTTWLKKSTGLSNDKHDDLSLVVNLVGKSQEDDDSLEEEIRDKRHRELSSRIEKLDMFIELSGLLRDDLTEHLENISGGDSSTDA